MVTKSPDPDGKEERMRLKTVPKSWCFMRSESRLSRLDDDVPKHT
jgi:hypothetical protein